MVRHGKSGTRVYKIWAGIIKRTCNTSHPNYKSYTKSNGGVPVFLNPSWRQFVNFYSDMGEDNGLTIERIDTTKGYYKENCRWATLKEQMLNRKRTGKFRGIKKFGVKYQARIRFEGKLRHIGTFKTPELASLAFNSCYFALYGNHPPLY